MGWKTGKKLKLNIDQTEAVFVESNSTRKGSYYLDRVALPLKAHIQSLEGPPASDIAPGCPADGGGHWPEVPTTGFDCYTRCHPFLGRKDVARLTHNLGH